MPWPRQASRIVAPSGTETLTPSIVSSTAGGASTGGASGIDGDRGGGKNQMGSAVIPAATPA